jgi:uncharacterized protein (DUF2235 family)
VYEAVRFPFTRATKNPDFQIVRHAVSIDERRAFFRQNLFGTPHDAGQDIKEVWFAGVHSDVGGSYPEQESQLSKLALRWMFGEAQVAGLAVDPQRKADILGARLPYVAPDPNTSNEHNSLTGLWWICELWPKVEYVEKADHSWGKTLRVNLGRRRYIPQGIPVHDSVELRLANQAVGYTPHNLPAQRKVISDSPGTRSATA